MRPVTVTISPGASWISGMAGVSYGIASWLRVRGVARRTQTALLVGLELRVDVGDKGGTDGKEQTRL